MGHSHSTASQIEYSVEVQPAANPSESPIYRRPDALPLPTPPPQPLTLYSLFLNSTNHFGQFPFLGTRESLLNGSFGRYTWESYADTLLKVNRLADSLGGFVEVQEGKMVVLGVYCKTRAEWVVTDLACMAQGMVSVMLLDTLGFDCISQVINTTEMTVMALSSVNKSVIYHLKREGEIPSLTHLIQFENVVMAERVEAQKLGFTLLSYSELTSSGGGNGPKRLPNPDSVYSICYTSGTYGPPTGIIITHTQIVTMTSTVTHAFAFTHDDVYFSFLPHAHIMERSLTYVAMSVGASIGYYSGNMSKLRDDLLILRPTLMSAVPRVLYKMADNIRKEVSTLSRFKKAIYRRAIKAKTGKYHATGKLTNKMWDALVLKPLKESFGGRLRLMLVGGAQMNSKELVFLRVALSIPIIEGYGLTESCACSFVTDPSDHVPGHVGGPLSFLEAKLINIKLTDRGEIEGELCLRGPTVARQSFRSRSKVYDSEMLVDTEGWLHTGDKVSRNPANGSFTVTGRLKDFFKLSHGEFISPEKIENCYKCPYIDQMVVYGNPLRSNLVALVVPNESKFRAFLDEVHPFRSEIPIEELCSSEEVRVQLMKKLKDLSAKHYLNAYERVSNVLLIPALDAEHYTSVGKVRRDRVLEVYRGRLEELYGAAK